MGKMAVAPDDTAIV